MTTINQSRGQGLVFVVLAGEREGVPRLSTCRNFELWRQRQRAARRTCMSKGSGFASCANRSTQVSSRSHPTVIILVEYLLVVLVAS
jgi:hypothetical protein